MKTVIISPYSQRMRNGNRNPKNFPFWSDVVAQLKGHGIRITQIGLAYEDPIGADEFLTNLSLKQIEELVPQAHTWAAVDNFFPHLCNIVGRPGVVVFGKSDPLIFGYPQNVNLLKNRAYLRHQQFDIWETEQFDPNVFVGSDEVVSSIIKLIKE